MTMAISGTSKQAYELFEEEWADYIGTDFAVSCNSGTSALHLALLALGVTAGDEVICPNFTMGAIPFAVSYTGAKPVFVDCDSTLNIDPSLIREKITSKTKAIIAVHTYGRPADMARILEYGIPVIEDCAEAHGATINGQKVGTLGVIGCFSFYRNKILHAEEGGAVVTNNPVFAEKMRHLKSMAFDKAHTYYHDSIGYNYRMTNATARILLGSLNGINEEIERRRKFAESLPYPQLPRPEGSVVWVGDCVFPSKQERDMVYERATNARLFFRPMTTLPMWQTDERGLAHIYSETGMYFMQ